MVKVGVIESNLRNLLDSRGMSARELSRVTGIHRESIRRLAADDIERIPRSVLAAVCNALDVTPGDLLIYTPNKSRNENAEI